MTSAGCRGSSTLTRRLIGGLPPERLDRLRALAADLRPLLPEAGGMQEVQRLLAERVDVMDAIIVTRELLSLCLVVGGLFDLRIEVGIVLK
jgi:hypothetical protein